MEPKFRVQSGQAKSRQGRCAAGKRGISRPSILRRVLPQPYLLLLLLALLIAGCRTDGKETAGELPATGFPVLEEFAPFYQRYGSQLLGEPISGACELADARLVQYFQRTRLQLAADGSGVTVYPLGEWAAEGRPAQPDGPAPAYNRQRYFEETGYTVGDEFLTFYESHNGARLLGPPISDQLDEGELRVQYFRNGRLEWHPDAPQEQRVRLSLLGQAHYVQAAHDVSCQSVARPMIVGAASDVTVTASVSAPILYSGDKQLLYVEVTTPAGVPVQGMPVQVTVEGAGDVFSADLGRTDGDGKVQGVLGLPEFQPGKHVNLTVRAFAVDGAAIGSTALSFQTWW